MDRKFWAKRGKQIVGPHATQDQALDAFRAAFPFNGPRYQASARKNQVMTGYGEFGPYSDLRWHDARDLMAERERLMVMDYVSEGLGEV